jgi:hypothetical protein
VVSMDMLILHHVLQVADHPRRRQVIAVEDERLVHVEADRERRLHALEVDCNPRKEDRLLASRDGPNLVLPTADVRQAIDDLRDALESHRQGMPSSPCVLVEAEHGRTVAAHDVLGRTRRDPTRGNRISSLGYGRRSALVTRSAGRNPHTLRSRTLPTRALHPVLMLAPAGKGSVSEVFDAEAPYARRGCVAQA